MLGLHNTIALQLHSFHDLEWWFTDGWVENGKGWRSCCCFLAPLGRWELQVLGHSLAPKSHGASAQVNGATKALALAKSGTRTFSSTTGDICCEKHISMSYGRGWGCAPQLHRRLLVSSVPPSPKHLQGLPSRPPLHKHMWQTHGVAEGTLVSGMKSCNKFPSDVCRAVFAPQGLPGASQTLNLLQQFQEEHSRQMFCVGFSCWVVIRTAIWRIRTSQSHRVSWDGRVAQGS